MPSQLAQKLVARGLLRPEEVSGLVREQASSGVRLDTLVLERGMPESEVLAALGEAASLSPVNLTLLKPRPEAAAFIPARVAERLTFVPVSLDKTTLQVACAYPIPASELEEVAVLLGKKLVTGVAPETRIRQWLAALYQTPLPPRFAVLVQALDAPKPPPPPPPSEDDLSPQMLEEIARRVAQEPLRQPAAKTSSGWSLSAAREALKKAPLEREQLISLTLSFANRVFDYVAAFALRQGTAVGWDAQGDGRDRAQLSQIVIPLDSPSVFRTAAVNGSSYFGPVPADGLSGGFLGLFGRAPKSLFLFPLQVKGRTVALLYGDSGAGVEDAQKVSELTLFGHDLSEAFEKVIAARKRQPPPAPAPVVAEPLFEVAAPEPVGPVPDEPAAERSWSPSVSPLPRNAGGRTVAQHPPTPFEGNRPPPDFTPLLRRLAGSDTGLRLRALTELLRTPEASAKVLAQHFPGPTSWARMSVSELPKADELGPFPGTLARLGRPAAIALAPLLTSEDANIRCLALLTAGSLPYPELADPLFSALFDSEGDIASCARAAVKSFKQVSRFAMKLGELRRSLLNEEPSKRALAARALGALHDRGAIEKLIPLTGAEDVLTAQAAIRALSETTLAQLGPNPKAWEDWWKENRSRRRAEWLVDALKHPQPEVRRTAIAGLSSTLKERFGFEPEAPLGERESAIFRWEQFLRSPGQGQAFEV